MQLTVVQRVLGLLLMAFSVTMVPPILVSLLYRDHELLHFIPTLALTFSLGLLGWFPVRNQAKDLRTRDGFIIVGMFWSVFGTLSALPFIFGLPHLSFTDAVFESVSAITTTGATVITGLDHLPPSILYYRQQLQWLGGMGIIVLAVAVLPLLGVGGMQLYRAETPGPMKDAKLTPRISQTARTLWHLYVGLTVACALSYWLAGMNVFDAVGHSFATVSTGGFSTHDASMGYFHNPLLEMLASVFMVLAAINFALHFNAWRTLSLMHYVRDVEVKAFLWIILALVVVVAAVLIGSHHYQGFAEPVRSAIFQVVSIITSTGFTTADFSSWPLFLPALLIFSSFIGGCAGSTAGGIKVIRIVVLFHNGVREVRQLIHPRASLPMRIGRRVLPERVSAAIWGFFSVYVTMFALMLLALMGTGLDQITAFSAVAACINNLGPGLGRVSVHFGTISDVAKWVLTFAMLAGRLEIFTLLVLVTPEFWRD